MLSCPTCSRHLKLLAAPLSLAMPPPSLFHSAHRLRHLFQFAPRYPLSLYSHKRQKGSRMGHSANLNQHSLPINSVVLKKIPCIPLRVRSLAVRLLPGAYFIPSKPQCSDGAVRIRCVAYHMGAYITVYTICMHISERQRRSRRIITGHASARDRSSSLTSTFSRAASSSRRAATSGLGSFNIAWRSRASLCLYASPGNLFCSDGKQLIW